MIKLRSKPLRSGGFSLYLDYNKKLPKISREGKVEFKRKLEYLNLRVSKDYTSSRNGSKMPRIAAGDKKVMLKAEKILQLRREAELFGEERVLGAFQQDGNFVAYYLYHMKASPPKNNSSYSGGYTHLKCYTQGNLRFRDLDLSWLEGFKSYLLTQVRKSTARTYLERLQTMFNIALKAKIVKDNPFETFQKPAADRKPPTFLVKEELEQLLMCEKHHVDEHVQLAFIFSCYTGLRFSDLKTLTWDEVHRGVFFCQKTQRTEDLVLTETSQHILDRVQEKAENDLVFRLRSLNHYNYQLKLWAKSAGLHKLITSHTGRHTCATMLVRNGTYPYTISKILGHANISTTQRYLHLLNSDKQRALDKLPQFNQEFLNH